MSDFKIEKAVPIPLREREITSYRTKYPFRELEVGDSFLAAARGDEKFKSAARSAASAANAFRSRTGIVLVTRRTPEGLRIWRAK